jgi:hypothetical protein
MEERILVNEQANFAFRRVRGNTCSCTKKKGISETERAAQSSKVVAYSTLYLNRAVFEKVVSSATRYVDPY